MIGWGFLGNKSTSQIITSSGVEKLEHLHFLLILAQQKSELVYFHLLYEVYFNNSLTFFTTKLLFVIFSQVWYFTLMALGIKKFKILNPRSNPCLCNWESAKSISITRLFVLNQRLMMHVWIKSMRGKKGSCNLGSSVWISDERVGKCRHTFRLRKSQSVRGVDIYLRSNVHFW